MKTHNYRNHTSCQIVSNSITFHYNSFINSYLYQFCIRLHFRNYNKINLSVIENEFHCRGWRQSLYVKLTTNTYVLNKHLRTADSCSIRLEVGRGARNLSL